MREREKHIYIFLSLRRTREREKHIYVCFSSLLFSLRRTREREKHIYVFSLSEEHVREKNIYMFFSLRRTREREKNIYIFVSLSRVLHIYMFFSLSRVLLRLTLWRPGLLHALRLRSLPDFIFAAKNSVLSACPFVAI